MFLLSNTHESLRSENKEKRIVEEETLKHSLKLLVGYGKSAEGDPYPFLGAYLFSTSP